MSMLLPPASDLIGTRLCYGVHRTSSQRGDGRVGVWKSKNADRPLVPSSEALEFHHWRLGVTGPPTTGGEGVEACFSAEAGLETLWNPRLRGLDAKWTYDERNLRPMLSYLRLAGNEEMTSAKETKRSDGGVITLRIHPSLLARGKLQLMQG